MAEIMGNPRVNESDEQKRVASFLEELTADTDTRTVMTKQKGRQFFLTKKGSAAQVKGPTFSSEQGSADSIIRSRVWAPEVDDLFRK